MLPLVFGAIDYDPTGFPVVLVAYRVIASGTSERQKGHSSNKGYEYVSTRAHRRARTDWSDENDSPEDGTALLLGVGEMRKRASVKLNKRFFYTVRNINMV